MKNGSEIQADKVYRIERGDFVYNRLFAWKGSFAVATAENHGCYVSNEFPCFTIKDDRASAEYLWRYFSRATVWDEALGLSTGGTPTSRNRLKEEKLLAMRIPLPPLAEQRRIVARIETLAAKITEARGLRQQAVSEMEAFWTSVLRSSFESNCYPLMNLETVCSTIIDNLHSTPTYDGSDFPCIRSQDVGWGTINYATALMTSEAEFRHRTQRGEPQMGDIVYVREGDIGRCAMVDGSRRFSLGQRVMMLRPNTNLVESKYLLHQLLSPVVLDDQVLNNKTGTTSHHVNIKHLRRVCVLVPPLPEQQRIVAYLDGVQAQVDAVRRLQAETAAALTALLPAVLDRAFRGKL